MEKDLTTKKSKISALEAEVSLLKKKLAESVNDLLESQKNEERFKVSEQELKAAIIVNEQKIETLSKDIETYQSQIKSVENENDTLQKAMDKLNEEHDQLLLQLDEIASERDDLKPKCQSLAIEREKLIKEVEELRKDLKNEIDGFAEKLDKSETVSNLRKKLQETEDELADKNKVCLKFII